MNICTEIGGTVLMYSVHCNFAQHTDLGIANEGRHMEYAT